jgi:hypothetical protein
MHANIRVYRSSLRNFEEVVRRVETGLVPILREIPGFRGYYAVECEGGVDVSVSLFEDEEGARASNERGAAWARDNLAELSDGRPPEMLVGRVLVAADG